MLNLPNILSAFRLAGSIVLIGLAIFGVRSGFAWLLGALLISDWIDGKLAIAWHQQTTFGARLDSVADNAMYGAMLFGMMRLYSEIFYQEWMWFGVALFSFALTSIAGIIKYRRLPSYHTRAAKTSWLLVSLAALSVFAQGPLWPLRLAAVVVIFTNLEATAMTGILPQWQADVPSIWHAIQLRNRAGPSSARF